MAGLHQREQQTQPRGVALVALLADGVEGDVRAARRQLTVHRRGVEKVLVAHRDPVRRESGAGEQFNLGATAVAQLGVGGDRQAGGDGGVRRCQQHARLGPARHITVAADLAQYAGPDSGVAESVADLPYESRGQLPDVGPVQLCRVERLVVPARGGHHRHPGLLGDPGQGVRTAAHAAAGQLDDQAETVLLAQLRQFLGDGGPVGVRVENRPAVPGTVEVEDQVLMGERRAAYGGDGQRTGDGAQMAWMVGIVGVLLHDVGAFLCRACSPRWPRAPPIP